MGNICQQSFQIINSISNIVADKQGMGEINRGSMWCHLVVNISIMRINDLCESEAETGTDFKFNFRGPQVP